MTRRVRSYDAPEITVEYDVRRCIHAEECVRGLPEAFDPRRRPWIDPNRAAADDLVRVIERCPTGALHYRRATDGATEQPPSTNSVRVGPEGPLYARGDLRIALPTGETLTETRAALCRCGRSQDKPFCDNSHRDEGFDDPGAIVEDRIKPSQLDGTGVLEISLAANGPIVVRGPVVVNGADGTTLEGGGGVLCRCGQAWAKPFCDQTHRAIGFEAHPSGPSMQ